VHRLVGSDSPTRQSEAPLGQGGRHRRFCTGVLRVSRRRSLSWVGGLLIAIGVVGFPTHTVWAMSSRGVEGVFNDTMHIILSAMFSVLLMTAMALSAVAYRGWLDQRLRHLRMAGRPGWHPDAPRGTSNACYPPPDPA
jgi:hypothetical protein